MTTLNDIITRAYRESQTIDIDETPSPEQQSEALTLLKGILKRSYTPRPQMIISLGTQPQRATGQLLRDFTLHAPNEPVPQNVILYCNLTSSLTLKMPYAPSDGARITLVDIGGNFASNSLTLEGNGSKVNGGSSAVLATNGETKEYFFRRDLGDWREIIDPTQFQNMPFPEDYDDMFVIELAGRLNPRYGNDMPVITVELFTEMRRRFKAQYTQSESSTSPDVLFDPGQGYVGDGGIIF